MNETTAQAESLKSPLHDLFAAGGILFSTADNWLVPSNFSDARQEYAAVREHGAGLLDLSSRARIRVSGTEAVLFLNGLITNDMKTLGQNQWMPAVFPNVQGRLLASVRVLRLADQGTSPMFLLDSEASMRERVLQTIFKFTMAGDFKVEDVTTTSACISIQGKDAPAIMNQAFGTDAQSGNTLQSHSWNGIELLVVHASYTGEEGYDIIVDAPIAVRIWQALLAAGAKGVGTKTLEVLRIEAGIPKSGVDMDESLVVSETNLDDAVSFTKGCYIGQEIIARIKYRGHVAKKISGVVLDSQVEPSAKLLSPENKEVGTVTSIAFSPLLQKWIGVALIKYQYLAAGTELHAMAESETIRCTVTDLPFVKGSWSQQA